MSVEVGVVLPEGVAECFVAGAFAYDVVSGLCHRGCSLGLLYRATVLFFLFLSYLFILFFSHFLIFIYMTKEKTSIGGAHQEHWYLKPSPPAGRTSSM